MFKNLRNKLAVLVLVALGLAFGNALGSQLQVTHAVIAKLLKDRDTCTPGEAVEAVRKWINSEDSNDALLKIAIYNMTGKHGLKDVHLNYTSSGTSHELDCISDDDQEILSFLFAVKDKWGVGMLEALQEQLKTAVTLSCQGGFCFLGSIIGVASCMSVCHTLSMPKLMLKRKTQEISYKQTIKIKEERFSSFVDYVRASTVRHNVILTDLMKSIYEELTNSSKQTVISNQRAEIAAHFVGKSIIKVVSETKNIKTAFSDSKDEKNSTMVICLDDQGSLTFSNWGGRNTANKLVLVVHKGNVDIAHFGPITM